MLYVELGSQLLLPTPLLYIESQRIPVHQAAFSNLIDHIPYRSGILPLGIFTIIRSMAYLL
jgi:hypothetical protein